MILHRYSECYWWTDIGLRLTVEPSEYKVVRETPKGYWITEGYSRTRFVLKGNGKRFAHENKEWAWHSFKLRKMRQRQHLLRQLDVCEAAIAVGEKLPPACRTLSCNTTRI